MGAVKFYAVETRIFGINCSIDPELLKVIKVGAGQRPAERRTVQAESRRTHGEDLWIEVRGRSTFCAEVPQLRNDRAAFSMNGVNDTFPPGQAFITVNVGNSRVRASRRVGDQRAFRNDQRGSSGSALAIIFGDILSGNTVREKARVMGAIAKRLRNFKDLTSIGVNSPATSRSGLPTTIWVM